MEYFYPELALAYLLVQDIFNFKRILLSLKREYQLTAMISWGGKVLASYHAKLYIQAMFRCLLFCNILSANPVLERITVICFVI